LYHFSSIKQKRQSGLLPPQIGYSNRKWEEYNQPFYIAINESSDATFYLYHMGRRGNKVALEYRYILDNDSKGTVMYDFLKDRKVDDGTKYFAKTGILQSSKEWGYREDSFLRPNTDRYWFRWKHDQAMPFGFSAKLDIDIISDHDYLHEFKHGYTGFEETSIDYYNNFGRDIDEYDDYTRVNSLSINKIWPQYSFNAQLRWYDNVINRRQADVDKTLQKLPLIKFNASKQKIYNTPFYIDFDSEYTYFYSNDGNRLHYLDLYPRFYLPYSFRGYFTLEPSFGVRETVWYIDDYLENTVEAHKILNRQLYDIKLDLSTKIYKIYSINEKDIYRIKHSIEPQIIYDYTPKQDQKKYPDNIGENNLVTYSITNTLTLRSKRYDAKQRQGPKDRENDEPGSYNYKQFCRFFIEQRYKIGEARDDNDEPFSPIYTELEFLPTKYLSLQADAEWCQYENSFLSRNFAVTLSDHRGDSLFVEHRYTFDFSESIYINVLVQIFDYLSVFGEYERNIYDNRNIRTGIGFLYKSQCWSIRGSYKDDEESDCSYGIIVSLYGLGEIGTGL